MSRNVGVAAGDTRWDRLERIGLEFIGCKGFLLNLKKYLRLDPIRKKINSFILNSNFVTSCFLGLPQFERVLSLVNNLVNTL